MEWALRSLQTELVLGNGGARFVLADGRRASSGVVVVPDPAMMSEVVDRLVKLAAVDEGLDVEYFGAEIEPSATVRQRCLGVWGLREDLEDLPARIAEHAVAASYRSEEERPRVVVVHDACEPFRVAPRVWRKVFENAPAGGHAVIAVVGGLAGGHFQRQEDIRAQLLDGTCVYFIAGSPVDASAAVTIGGLPSEFSRYPRGTGLVFQNRRLVGTWTL
jgi:hypothetical protein